MSKKYSDEKLDEMLSDHFKSGEAPGFDFDPAGVQASPLPFSAAGKVFLLKAQRALSGRYVMSAAIALFLLGPLLVFVFAFFNGSKSMTVIDAQGKNVSAGPAYSSAGNGREEDDQGKNTQSVTDFSTLPVDITSVTATSQTDRGTTKPYSKETKNEETDWSNDNSIIVEIQPKYFNEVLQDVSGAFSLLDLKAVYITNKAEDDMYSYLVLRLVLNNGGQDNLNAAITKLQKDPRVKEASVSNDVPFETINTLQLTKSIDNIKVGETVAIKPEGELKVYKKQFLFDRITISLNDYDPNKEYTPADFPQFNIASIIKHEYSWGTYFILTLAQPGYFNVLKAVNAFALDSKIKNVTAEPIAYLTVVYPPKWKISDTSIAELITDENGGVTIKGLKPGTITITYTPSLGDSYGPEVTCEITVI